MRPFTVGIDYRPALSRMTGVGRYVSGLTAALARIDAENDYVLFSSSLRERARVDDMPPNFRLVDRHIPVRFLNWTWHRLGWPPLESLSGCGFDITHSPHPLILPSRRGRRIVTIHDLFFYRHPELTRAEVRRDYAQLVKENASRADAVLAVSEATAVDVERELGVPRERVVVVHNGLDLASLAPKPELESQIAVLYDLPSRFVLFVGTLEPRKNLLRLVEATRMLIDRGWDGTLVLVGGEGMGAPEVDRTILRLGVGGRVRKLGYVSPSHLPAIYRRAQILVNPSLWEGFGLPPLEAMACHVPTIVSDIPAHREIAGDAACYVDANDISSIAESIEQVWNDDDLRKRMSATGAERVSRFTWTETARKTLRLYRQLAEAA